MNGEKDWGIQTVKYGCVNLTDNEFEQMIERLMNGSKEQLYNYGDVEKIVSQVECLFNEKVTVTDVEVCWKLSL